MTRVVHTVISLISYPDDGFVDAWASISHDDEPYELLGYIQRCSPEFLKRAQGLVDDIQEP